MSRPYTPARLAELLAALQRQGVAVRRARIAPDGGVDIELAAAPTEAHPFDLADMKR